MYDYAYPCTIVLSTIISVSSLFYICMKQSQSKTITIWMKLLRKFTFPSMPYKVPETNVFDYLLPPFPNTWYPVCMYREIIPGKIKPIRIAGCDLIIYLDNQSQVQIQERYCPHMGVDLRYGSIQKDCIICPFHHHCISPKKPNLTIGQTKKTIYVSEVVCVDVGVEEGVGILFFKIVI